jgi:hypothetical protein
MNTALRSAFFSLPRRFSYRASAPGDAAVTGVRALVDGRPAQAAKGLAISQRGDAVLSIDVPVPDRSCSVSLIAENRNGASEASTIQLVKAAQASAAVANADEFTIKPKLYVLAVGVSAYDNPDYKLASAAKDARDLAAAFTRQKGGIFREAEVKVLVDNDASKDNILDGLERIQRQTTSKDVAVMFFSGHGLNDSTQNYYYLPVGVERDIAATVNELASAENGAVVFASSTGSQYSYEDPAWGNGVFTKALIEGLSGKAAYGSTPRITVNMLDLYLSERVKALTGGRQTPTTTKPANVPDFPVAVKRQ